MSDTQQIEVISRDKAETELPQAVNCIDFFRKRFFNKLGDELNKNVWIAGGSVRDWFSDGVISKDVDFFCNQRSEMAKLIKLLRNEFQFKHYMITNNAIKGNGVLFGKRIQMDIVKKEFPNPVSCVDAFDFTVCCFAVSADNFYYHKSSIFDLIKKKLVVHSLPHPVDTMKRMNKYVKKGFTACNGTILTIAKAIANLDATRDDIFDFYKFD